MRRLTVLWVILMLCASALAETPAPTTPPTVGDYLRDELSYTISGVESVDALGIHGDVFVGDDAGVSLFGVLFANGRHSFFWRDADGAVAYARNISDELISSMFGDALARLSVLNTYSKLGKQYGFDVGMYVDADVGAVCYGLARDDAQLQGVVRRIAAPDVPRCAVGWDDFAKVAALLAMSGSAKQ